MGFPQSVTVQPAPAVAGDFASANPRSSVVNGPGAFVAGALGIVVGRFAWADAANLFVNNFGAGAPTGFVARQQQALITQFLGENSNIVQQGLGITLYNMGDFWVKNEGNIAAVRGMKVYANNATGAASFNVMGAPPAGATILGANQTIVANSFTGTLAANTMTASINGTTMTVSAIGAGTVLYAGQTIGGVGVDPATTVVRQLTGTTGNTGTYQVSVQQNVASVAMTASGGGLTITARTSGALIPGQVISGTGVPAGTTVVGYGTFASAIATSGTIAISAQPTAGSGVTITGAGAYLTVSTAITGTIVLNDTVLDTTTPANMPANTYVSAFISGTGGLGTYMLSNAGATAATTDALSIPSATETRWYAAENGAVGDLLKVTSHAL